MNLSLVWCTYRPLGKVHHGRVIYPYIFDTGLSRFCLMLVTLPCCVKFYRPSKLQNVHHRFWLLKVPSLHIEGSGVRPPPFLFYPHPFYKKGFFYILLQTAHQQGLGGPNPPLIASFQPNYGSWQRADKGTGDEGKRPKGRKRVKISKQLMENMKEAETMEKTHEIVSVDISTPTRAIACLRNKHPTASKL